MEAKHIIPDKNLLGVSNFASSAFNVVIQLAKVPGTQSRVRKQEGRIDAIIKYDNDANGIAQIKNAYDDSNSTANINVNDNQTGVTHGTNVDSPDGESEHDDSDDNDKDEYQVDINGNTTSGDFGFGNGVDVDVLEKEKVYHAQLQHQGTNIMSEGHASVFL